MDRGNLINNISKLNTFITMSKTNDYLHTYIEKLFDKKSKNMKFINDFDTNTTDLLYSSLQLMSNKGPLSSKEFNKIDKKELKYYIDKAKGIKHYNKQFEAIKNEEQLLNAIKTSCRQDVISLIREKIQFETVLWALRLRVRARGYHSFHRNLHRVALNRYGCEYRSSPPVHFPA